MGSVTQKPAKRRPVRDVIVVGGGHNSLVAACYLAQAGLDVTVIERRDRAGGLASELEFFPGYTAAITNSPGSFQPLIVHELDLEGHGLSFARPDPSLVFPFDEERAFVAWRDTDRVFAQLEAVSPRDAIAYGQFFLRLEGFASRLRLSLFEPPPPLRTIVADLTTEDDDLLHNLLFGSVQDLLEQTFESDEVRALIGSTAAAAGLASPGSSGSLMQLLLRPLSMKAGDVGSGARPGGHDPRGVPLRGSTGLPIGGMGAIPNALVRCLESFGGTVRTGAEVDRILCRGDVAYGVALADGEILEADLILSGINIQTTFFDLLEGEWSDPVIDRHLSQLQLRGSAFKVGVALAGLPTWGSARGEDDAAALSGCQFRIAPRLDVIDTAVQEGIRGIPSTTPLLWGLIPSVADPSLAPDGHHVLSINAFHAPYQLADGGDWHQEKDAFGRRCIDTLARYMPDLPGLITDVRFWSPVDLAEEYGLVRADITHGEMLTNGVLGFRGSSHWSEYRTPIEGLYLCGSSVWPGGFVSGLPGRNAAMQVIRDHLDA
jgi:phytoene dehydrogenase-like protein